MTPDQSPELVSITTTDGVSCLMIATIEVCRASASPALPVTGMLVCAGGGVTEAIGRLAGIVVGLALAFDSTPPVRDCGDATDDDPHAAVAIATATRNAIGAARRRLRRCGSITVETSSGLPDSTSYSLETYLGR